MEYTWEISALECKVKEGDLDNVIYTIHWRYKASKVVQELEVTADTYGSLALSTPEAVSFVPYADVTEEIVIGWLEASLEVDEIKTKLDKQVDLQINPISVTHINPFA